MIEYTKQWIPRHIQSEKAVPRIWRPSVTPVCTRYKESEKNVKNRSDMMPDLGKIDY